MLHRQESFFNDFREHQAVYYWGRKEIITICEIFFLFFLSFFCKCNIRTSWQVLVYSVFNVLCVIEYCYGKKIGAWFCYIQSGIQNIPDRCRHRYSSCGSAKHRFQQVKLWIPGSTAKFCGDCMKTCKDFARNFRENRPGLFTVTTHRLTLPFSPSIFGRNTKCLSFPTHRTPLIWHSVNSSCFKIWNWSWNDAVLLHWGDPGRFADFTKALKNGGDGGSEVYMREKTTSRVVAADSP
jgi:hypothetical protein